MNKNQITLDAEDDIFGDGRQFTAEERRMIRKIIEQEARVAWFWSTVRLWLGWASAAVVAGYAVYQATSGWIQASLKKAGV